MRKILEEALKEDHKKLNLERIWKDKFGLYSGYNFNIRNNAHHLQLEEQTRLETCFSILQLEIGY